MIASEAKLRIGFIPLADAAALIVAVDKGFTGAKGSRSSSCARYPGRTYVEFCTAQSFCTLL
jgi:hypothetical protein